MVSGENFGGRNSFSRGETHFTPVLRSFPQRSKFSPSRGTTIITQKENKGEYNGSWAWNNSSYDYNIYAHVFDQVNSSGTPYRYSSATAIGSCPSADIENSTVLANRAQNLYGNNQKISNQTSCKPHVYNAGNWYNFPAATAGSNNVSTSTEKNMPNSICPKGWQLPPSAGDKSYQKLIRAVYNIYDTATDANLLANSAMSFVRLGNYSYGSGSLNYRGDSGDYWSSTAYSSGLSPDLYFHAGHLNPQNGADRAYGLPLRCVAR